MEAVAFPLEIESISPPPRGEATPPETTESPSLRTAHVTGHDEVPSARAVPSGHFPNVTPRAESPAETVTLPRKAPPAPQPVTWTGTLLASDAVFSLPREAKRFGVGLGLAAIYGLALGARDGRAAFLSHAVGVPAALLVAFGVGTPALYIVLALLNAPVVPARIASAATRATAAAGLVLAGLAPAAAMFVVSSEHRGAASLAAVVGLAIGGAFGLGHVVSDLRESFQPSSGTTRALSNAVLAVFSLFGVLVTLRVWASLLPLLGGGR